MNEVNAGVRLLALNRCGEVGAGRKTDGCILTCVTLNGRALQEEFYTEYRAFVCLVHNYTKMHGNCIINC
jgi:hypothetical protein